MPYVPATQKPLLRAKFDAALGAAVDIPAGLMRQAVVDVIVDWFGTDVLPTLLVATTTAGTANVASGSSAGIWPTTGAGTGGVT